MITITGKIEKQDLGFGVWSLVTEQGEVYELMEPPGELCHPHPKVQVTGNIRDDVMTISMIGPVLEVISFDFLE